MNILQILEKLYYLLTIKWGIFDCCLFYFNRKAWLMNEVKPRLHVSIESILGTHWSGIYHLSYSNLQTTCTSVQLQDLNSGISREGYTFHILTSLYVIMVPLKQLCLTTENRQYSPASRHIGFQSKNISPVNYTSW